jgi:hypothetical protein
MRYQPRERSVSDELALLQYLAASRRVASFKAQMARHQQSLRPTTGPAMRLLPPDLPAPAPALDKPTVHGAYNVRMRTEP